MSGAHNTLCPAVIDELKKRDAGDIVVFAGGIIPDADFERLKAAGVSGIFTPGTSLEAIIQWVRDNVRPKQRDSLPRSAPRRRSGGPRPRGRRRGDGARAGRARPRAPAAPRVVAGRDRSGSSPRRIGALIVVRTASQYHDDAAASGGAPSDARRRRASRPTTPSDTLTIAADARRAHRRDRRDARRRARRVGAGPRTGVVLVASVPRGGERFGDVRAALEQWRPIERRPRLGRGGAHALRRRRRRRRVLPAVPSGRLRRRDPRSSPPSWWSSPGP